MRAENYISDLLYRYQCVTVPQFGAFLTQYKPARVHETTHAFYPPSKEISFNAQLTTNDGLLARYISEVENIDYEEALSKLDELVSFWKKQLENREKLSLKNIGELTTNDEGSIQFQPSYQVNYLTSAFGLSSFVSPAISREMIKQEVVSQKEEKVPVLFTLEKRERPPYLRYAAIGLLAISLGAAGYKYFSDYNRQQFVIAEQQAAKKVEETIQQATFFDTKPVELPSVHFNLIKENVRFYIVAGAFRIEANAERKVKQLLDRGFKAERIGKNRYGLHQVSYAGFSDVDAALKFLRDIKKNESSDAWLLVTE